MNIIRTQRYIKDLKRMGVSELEWSALEEAIAINPEAGDLIPGLEGLRKIRFAMRNRGKRGGGRAIYYLMMSDEMVLMITAYAKSEREDLSPDQKKAIVALLREFKNG
ncbi:hypothetical protein IHQ71_20560 [Rhizobium sp. TH2]|uniref:type II toxin-antitoxin system RelE/ParE family toxin n=1 Tax=Rhizobium sp. TH2 TaxID=2775403 RepID=UPI0021575275|nr:type II toxin-antitoxin system RelE/ParE family toxin [Rhizobium sp. TH2]UVC07572.1 hypothetical protein IHQ71_20560 [Rhizobium sp. TH2]